MQTTEENLDVECWPLMWKMKTFTETKMFNTSSPKSQTKAEFLLTISIKYQVGEWWDKEKYKTTEYWLIQYQILWTNIIRIVWKTVMRITKTSWGWKSYISRRQRLVSRDAQALLKCNPFFLLKSNRGGESIRIPFK